MEGGIIGGKNTEYVICKTWVARAPGEMAPKILYSEVEGCDAVPQCPSLPLPAHAAPLVHE